MTAEGLLGRRKSFVVCALLLALFGAWAYREMPRRLEPEVDVAIAVVEARLPGVSSRELEQVLTRRIEEALDEVSAVRGLRSRTRDGAALVLVELVRTGKADRADALASIEARLTRLRESLAASFVGLDGPYLVRTDARLPEGLMVVPGDGASTPVAAAERLAELLRRREEVASVEVVGHPQEIVRLTYDDGELVRAGITPLVLRDLLRAHHFTAPGAYWTEGGRIVPLEARSRLDGLAALEALEVRDPADGDAVQLTRLVEVERVPLTPSLERVQAKGRAAVALAVTRADGTALEAFGAAVRDELSRARDGGSGAELVVLQPDVVAGEIEGFETSVAQSFVAILLLLVVVLGVRSGVVVAMVVLAVVSTSLGLLALAGLPLDVVSLASFILVLGLLVDNHVVMAERIQRLGERGLTRSAAVGGALTALRGPLVAASATTALGFLPVALTDDVIGDYVRSLFWVVLTTLAVSLVFAFTVTPLLIKGRPRPDPQSLGVLGRIYRAGLGVSLRAPVLMLLLLGLLLWQGRVGFERADQIFFPASARPLWMLELELPAGTSLEETASRTASLDGLLAAEPEEGPLAGWVTFLGRSAPRFQASLPARRFAPHYAQVLLTLDPARDSAPLRERLADWIEGADDDARVRLRPVRLGAELEWPIEVELRGPESETLAAAEAVAAELRTRGGMHVHHDWGAPIAKRRVELDRAALAERNLTAADVSVGIHAVVHGLPVFDVPDERGAPLPVMLRARAGRDDREEALNDAYVYPVKGEPSLLYEVARVEKTQDHPERARHGGRAAVTVTAETMTEGSGLRLELEIADDLAEITRDFPGVEASVRGLSASAERANRALLDEVPLALLLVLVLLLLQSQSIRESLLIVVTIPAAFAGVAFGLRVTGEPFSFMTLVGMTALAGIVVNNAIVLLASVRTRLAEAGPDDSPRALLIEASVERLRPILLTTLCALASMIVLYRSGGSMWQPLATATISGLVVSTLVVLLLLPALYALLFRVRREGRGTGA